MIRLLYFMLLVFPFAPQAQFTYVMDQSIPVQTLDGESLSMPWAGGLNAAQYNTMDLDLDGADDLVLFDRMAGKVITFLNVGAKYVPAPEFENFFPPEVSSWLLLRDYNCDGKKDVFTGDALGIRVFTNTTSPGNSPAWQQFLFSSGFAGSKSTVLLTEGFSSKINLQLQFDDLPSISDVDGDGDLDILSMRYVGGGDVELHQNLSMENHGTCDSLEFKRITQTWGDFKECACGEFAFNGLSCAPENGGRTQHAGGKSLLALDLNNDDQQDLLLSEAECSEIYALPNTGTTIDPVINEFFRFPENNPATLVYPASYYEDVDFDGKKDLIVSPNIFTKELINMNLSESNWLYKNTGTASSPTFSLVERDYLQKEMIDIGDNAVPAFGDYDGDGDLDLLVSKNSSAQFRSTIHFFENTGTNTSPSFKCISEDFLGFSASRLYNVKIQMADLNSDAKMDLVFTGTSFDNNTTNLYYLANNSPSILNFTGSAIVIVPFPMTYNENVFVTDVNNDGLPDILAGRTSGELEYWKNDGIKGAPTFALEDDSFLGISSSTLRQNVTSAAEDLDADGKTDLMVGDQNGRLGVISNYRESAGATIQYNVVFNPRQETYSEKNLGGRIWPTAVNLFNSNKPAIVIGNTLGGLHVLKNDEGQSLPENPRVNIYPNPVSATGILNIKTDRLVLMQIISILGQRLTDPIALQPNQIHRYTVPSLPSGVYLVKFTADKKSTTERIIIQ